MEVRDYDDIINKALQLDTLESLNDAFQICRKLEIKDGVTVRDAKTGNESFIYDEDNFRKAHIYNRMIRTRAKQRMKDGGLKAAMQYRRCLLFDAPHDFDSFCIYLEMDREPSKKFYIPRRKQLLPLVEALQELETGDLNILGISLPPGVGKTTLAIFFLCWISGRRPEMQSLIGSHNNDFLRGVYDECLRIMHGNGEYLWSDVFPATRIVNTNAKDMRIDLGTKKRFQTLEFSSIGSGNAGRILPGIAVM